MSIKAPKNAWSGYVMPKNWQTRCQYPDKPGYICGKTATHLAGNDFSDMGVCDEHAEFYRGNPDWTVFKKPA